MRFAWWADVLPAVLDVLVEAAWIAVPYRLMELAAMEQPVLGLPSIALVVAAALLVGRWLRRWTARTGGLAARGRSTAAVGGVLAVAAVMAATGWLASQGVRDATGSGDLAAAVSRHPGGWLVGLAWLRGVAHAQGQEAGSSASRGLRSGLPVLVLTWLAAGLAGTADQETFRGDALPDTVVFVAASLLGVGLGGLRAQARQGDFDWQANRSAPTLLVAVVGLVVLAAIPAALVLGGPLVDLLLALARPLLGLCLLVILVRTAPRAVVYMAPWAILLLGLVVFFRLLGVGPADLDKLAQDIQHALQLAPLDSSAGGRPGAVPLLVLWLAVLAALAALLLLVRSWLRRRLATPGPDLFEERSVVVEQVRFRPRLPFAGWYRRRGGGPPTDAVAAYKAALLALAGAADLRRGDAESPAEHAARLRSWPAWRPLRHLAADYELARFGGRTLTPPEEARALRRWRSVREALRRR